MISPPTQGETYSKIMEYLRKLEEECAMMAHLANANDDRKMAVSWLVVSENFKKMQHKITDLAMGRLN